MSLNLSWAYTSLPCANELLWISAHAWICSIFHILFVTQPVGERLSLVKDKSCLGVSGLAGNLISDPLLLLLPLTREVTTCEQPIVRNDYANGFIWSCSQSILDWPQGSQRTVVTLRKRRISLFRRRIERPEVRRRNEATAWTHNFFNASSIDIKREGEAGKRYYTEKA